jgi:hypothetical protein
MQNQFLMEFQHQGWRWLTLGLPQHRARRGPRPGPARTLVLRGHGPAHQPRLWGEKVVAFLKEHTAKSVIVTDGIIGCPHEEGIDYPEGKSSTVIKNFLPIRDNRLISGPIVQSWLSPPLSVHRSQLLVLNPEPVKDPSGLA